MGPAEVLYHDINGLIEEENYYIMGETIDLNKYNNIKMNKMIKLIQRCNDIYSIFELKLIANLKFKEEIKLFELIESKLIMLELI